MYLFQQCRKIAGSDGVVNVAVNPDEFVEEFKGQRPIQSYAERRAILSANKYIDNLFPTPGPDAKPLIEIIKPDFIVIGSDWAPPRDYYAQLDITQEYLYQKGIGLLYLDRVGEHSSTNLKERIRAS